MRPAKRHRILATILAAALIPACGAAGPPPAQAQSATRFVRDPARFRANQQKLVAALRRQSPQMADAVAQGLSGDLIATLAPELRKLGLNADDMADMTAAYWVAAWEAAHDIVGRRTDPALLAGARRQIAGTMAAGAARMTDADRQDVADMMLLQALLIDARMKGAAQGGAAARRRMSDAIAQEAGALLKTDLRAVDLSAAGFKPAGGAAATPSAAAGTGTAPAHAENWQRVEGVYFKSYSTFGVGGMAIQDFEPVVLFRDGRYYEVEGPALEDVDLTASQARKPGAWGKWRKQGATFLLTDHKGNTHDYQLQQGSFFKAFPAEAGGGRLSRPYKRISGGGDAALGGTMAIAAQSRFAFAPDGRFTGGTSMGASGAGVAAYGRRPAAGGQYRIARHTITMTGPDGRPVREFFAFGSQGTPARFDDDMLFMGDRVFVKDD